MAWAVVLEPGGAKLPKWGVLRAVGVVDRARSAVGVGTGRGNGAGMLHRIGIGRLGARFVGRRQITGDSMARGTWNLGG